VNEREQIAWLYRRVGFGLAPGQLDELAAKGVERALDELLAPAPSAPDPWVGLDLSAYDPQGGGQNRGLVTGVISRWMVAMATSPHPFDEWMRWFWHGHFVSTIRVVQFPQLMVQQLRLFGQLGLGDFRTLLAAITTDPAMLFYLDGVTNKKDAVNENYGREVLELFALGIGNYTEQDVRAGAEALTGWRVDRRAVLGTSDPAVAVFEPRRHDDRAKEYLGVAGVHDVTTVVDAIVQHPACAPFIAAKLARAILGPDVDDGLLQRLAKDFAASGLQIRPLVRAILEAGLGGASSELVLAPVPWTVAMVKAGGAPADKALGPAAQRALAPAGQVPLDAPNVAGWPGGRSWLSSSTTVARFNLAAALAALIPAGAEVRSAAKAGDHARLADLLGHPAGFTEATAAALRELAGHDTSGDGVLTVAMASPDVVIA
jgi:uncharacterized protein (DUF1800 family)